MKYLWFYIVCWKHQDHTRFEMFEAYTLVLKAARRCAYDLNHASAAIKSEESTVFWERSNMWLEIFSPTGGKDYQHKLHHDIWRLELEIKRLEGVCKSNNIDPVDPDSIPF